MDDQAQVHQAVADDRVRHEGDKNQGEVRTNPAVDTAPSEQGNEEIHADATSAADEKTDCQVVKLSPSQSSRVSPLHSEEDEGSDPHNE
ncbi:MAG: hypothetical protein AAB387_10175, partial [candidate division NC10 bacterium]